MASLRDIRKRIRSVRNTQKITGAMKLVSASKLRRAQDAIVTARPYAIELGSVLRRVSARAQSDGAAAHPVLEMRTPKRVLVVAITSDRGLCGAFNANILRKTERFIAENKERFEHLEVATIGRKARDHFQKRKVVTVRDYPGVFQDLTYRRASEIAHGLIDEFVNNNLDTVILCYNEFKSAISQKVVAEVLLPLVREDLPQDTQEGVDFIYEPSQSEVLEKLIPRYVTTQVWRALLESSASEHGARMAAMDSATKNAKELSGSLTLQYNRTRQAAITRELMEIVGGAEALKG